MAPRQRNVSASSSPAASGEESYSDDGSATSLIQENKARSTTKTLKTKPTSIKSITEADIARDNHDYFNIVALAIVVYTVAINYEYPSLTYTGDSFYTMWAVSLFV